MYQENKQVKEVLQSYTRDLTLEDLIVSII